MVTLVADWLAEDGSQLATNQVDLVCVAAEPASVPLCVIDNAPLAAVLRGLGYRVRAGQAGAGAAGEIVVACRYTARAGSARAKRRPRAPAGRFRHVRANPTPSEPAVPLPVGHIVPRAGTPWEGDWANSFAWIKKQGPLAHLPGGPLLEMEWAPLMPNAVIAGLPSWVQRSHSWAGLAVGWVHQAVSLLLVMPYGRGRLLTTTFKLNATTLAADPVAQALFAGALNLL